MRTAGFYSKDEIVAEIIEREEKLNRIPQEIEYAKQDCERRIIFLKNREKSLKKKIEKLKDNLEDMELFDAHARKYVTLQ